MKIEITVTYLPVFPELNLDLHTLATRISSNNIVKTMAEDLIEKFDKKEDFPNVEKVVFTIDACEKNGFNLTRDYIFKE